MSQFAKMLYLLSVFEDKYSRMMVIFEWINEDPILDVRFALEVRQEGILL